MAQKSQISIYLHFHAKIYLTNWLNPHKIHRGAAFGTFRYIIEQKNLYHWSGIKVTNSYPV